jgi:hypothetical protein
MEWVALVQHLGRSVFFPQINPLAKLMSHLISGEISLKYETSI